jgi:hypothetical protein
MNGPGNPRDGNNGWGVTDGRCAQHPGVDTLPCYAIHYTPEQARAYVRMVEADIRAKYPNLKPGDPVPAEFL